MSPGPDRALRLVLDTNVAVSGFLTRGAAHEIIDVAVRHPDRVRLGASEENRAELLETLRADRVIERLRLRDTTPEQLYVVYSALTDPPVVSTAWRGRWSRDPDDDAFLATAFAFGADLLVTRDSDLLQLKHFYGCQIEEPGRALDICRKHPPAFPDELFVWGRCRVAGTLPRIQHPRWASVRHLGQDHTALASRHLRPALR